MVLAMVLAGRVALAGYPRWKAARNGRPAHRRHKFRPLITLARSRIVWALNTVKYLHPIR